MNKMSQELGWRFEKKKTHIHCSSGTIWNKLGISMSWNGLQRLRVHCHLLCKCVVAKWQFKQHARAFFLHHEMMPWWNEIKWIFTWIWMNRSVTATFHTITGSQAIGRQSMALNYSNLNVIVFCRFNSTGQRSAAHNFSMCETVCYSAANFQLCDLLCILFRIEFVFVCLLVGKKFAVFKQILGRFRMEWLIYRHLSLWKDKIQ